MSGALGLQSPTFTKREISAAVALALFVQILFFSLLLLFGNSRGAVVRELPPEIEEIPIAVQPVLDELPLLKLGSKNPVKQRLPEMWKKKAPTPVKRYEERSAPSAEAEDSVDKIPESELADKKHKAPPKDAEIVKKLEQELEEPDEEEKQPELSEEGAADGSEFGTETDPLKARQIDLYRGKIAGWFNARFKQPTESVPCSVLKKLSSSVAVSVGGDRRIAGFSIVSPSGNAAFDSRVRSTMQALVGEQLPPPPPLYPDILGTTLSPRLSGTWAACTESATPSPPKGGSGDTSPPSDDAGDSGAVDSGAADSSPAPQQASPEDGDAP